MTSENDGEKEQAATRITAEKYREIRVAAAKRDMSIADWLREAIDEKMDSDAIGDNSGNPNPVAV